jgi:uncharacterized repeat protein (TIGR01451 family)
MKIKPLFISLTLSLGLTLALVWLLSGSLPAARAQGPDGPKTHYVAPGGDCGSVTPCHASVQDAVKKAKDGDIIKVAAGTYTDVNTQGDLDQVVYIDKTLTICGGYTATNWTTPYPITQPTTLNAHGDGRVLYIASNIHPTIEGLRITGGNATGLGGGPEGEDSGGGLYVITARATISNNQVFSNTAVRGGGLYLRNSDATLSGNTINDNIALEGGGLRLSEYSSATLSYNTIAFNTAEQGGGLYLSNYCTATLSNNDITANAVHRTGGGLRLSDYSSATLSHNIIKANTANFGGGLFLALTSTATLSDNTFICNSARTAGGGLRLAQNGSARLISNTITANTAYNGGGMHLNNSTAELSDNIFAANEALHNGGGLMLAFTSTATLSGNRFAANEAKHGGGGLYVCQHSSATLSGDTVISNTITAADYGGGGGLALATTSTLTCANTIIADNRVNGPPGIGAGLAIADSTAHLLHTTIARNSGGDDSGIHVTERHGTYSTVALTNTILVGHKVGITVTDDNTATLEATLWGNGNWANDARWGSDGTITPIKDYPGNPAFVDPDAGDYHIGLGSAALGLGVPTIVHSDIDNEPRPRDKPDLGADEFPPVADLAITKINRPDQVIAGENLFHELEVTNNGPSDATDVTLTDVLPTGVKFEKLDSALPDTCTCKEKNGTVTCDLDTLAAGKSGKVWLLVSVDPSTVDTITNIASVTATEPDPDESDNTATVDTLVNSKADLALDKTVDDTTPDVGETVVFTITMTNNGPSDATGVQVTDQPPSGYTYVSGNPSQGTYTSDTGVWAVGNLSADSSATLAIIATVNARGDYDNYTQVSASNEHDPDSTPGDDSTTQDDDDSQSTTPNLVADLAITKIDSPDPVIAGQNLTHTITVTNTGPSDATSVALTDVLPVGVTFVWSDPDAPTCTEAGGTVTCELGTLDSKASATVLVGVEVNPSTVGTITNTTSVTSTVLDPHMSNNRATSATVVSRKPCLSLPTFGAVLLVLLNLVFRRKK